MGGLLASLAKDGYMGAQPHHLLFWLERHRTALGRGSIETRGASVCLPVQLPT